MLPVKEVADDVASDIVSVWVDKAGIFNIISQQRIRIRVVQQLEESCKGINWKKGL